MLRKWFFLGDYLLYLFYDFNLRKILFFTIIFFTITCYSQRIKLHEDFISNPNFQKIFTSAYATTINDSVQITFLYKVPISELIFIKTKDSFSASLQIMLEVVDSASLQFQTYFRDHKISFEAFEKTIDPSEYLEGIINFRSKKSDLYLNSSFLDNNSNKNIFTRNEKIYPYSNDKNIFLMPIVLNEQMMTCDSIYFKSVVNYGGMIPFDNNYYDILIPLVDTTIEKLLVKVISRKDTVFSGIVQKSETAFLRFIECDNKILLKEFLNSHNTNNFYLRKLTPKLKEGIAEIIVSDPDDSKRKNVYKLIVKWIKKPKSLLDSEKAIKLLQFIIKEDSVKKLLNLSRNFDSVLNNYWKPLDPTPETEFNELMAEYYQRVDFADENFSTITGTKGLESDRGRIYILYGKPSSIRRVPNANKRISEIWDYAKLKKQFVFVDERGTGDYKLKSTR